MGRSETDLKKGCRPGWCWNSRRRDCFCCDGVHDSKSVVRRSPARSGCVSGRASPSVCGRSAGQLRSSEACAERRPDVYPREV